MRQDSRDNLLADVELAEAQTATALADMKGLVQRVADPTLRSKFVQAILEVYMKLMEERSARMQTSLEQTGNLVNQMADGLIRERQRNVSLADAALQAGGD
ncbi:MAG: hypothetical protein PHX87_00190 [Candidatus Peribacteraceae bacterium]|nr:hypothetical protein [Candidatus Peribacteraceae bacterium]MDD5741827.1 hypothetical protein [Candidatus Peribacteraceae bacterium]